jgi:hypothetical protein
MAGISQEAASRAIGHELSLIGVPAPTTLDGYRPASPDEMKIFMISVGLLEARAIDVATALKDDLNITSIVQFGWWFAECSLKDWFMSHDTWKTDAPLFVALKWALSTCSAIDTAKAKHQEQLKEDEKIPMDPVLNKSLNETWQRLYKVPLAPSQELSSQVLNGMYRGLFNRNGEAKPVEGLYTKENVPSLDQDAREAKRRRRMSADFDLVDKLAPDSDRNPHFHPYKSPWLFLIALENLLRTFCKAGTYMVEDPNTGTPAVNVEKAPIEEHLVMARKFVFEWTIKEHPPPEGAVIRQLARIDIHIRRRWWKNYNGNPSWTFTRAIKGTEGLADNQWSFDYSSILYEGDFTCANEPAQESAPGCQEDSADYSSDQIESARWQQEDIAEDSGDHGEGAPWHQEDSADDYSQENIAADSGDWDDCAENIAEEEWDYSEWEYNPTNNVGPNWEYTGSGSRARSASNRYWS